MNAIYLECKMGAAGDMLMSALLELLEDPSPFMETMNALGIPGVSLLREESRKCGIRGTHLRVLIDGKEEHSHDVLEHHKPVMSLEDLQQKSSPRPKGAKEIQECLKNLPLPGKVRQDALAVFSSILEAESQVHGQIVEEFHLHVIGSWDAVVDVVGVCYLMYLLGPTAVKASPVHVGSGWVRCAHGTVPVPAPATAYLLRGVPSYSENVKGELCTPTGAALLRYFVQEFGPMPLGRIQAAGYGMGSKDFSRANCLRAFAYEPETGENDQIAELSCNLDDMTPEQIGRAVEILLEEGAFDAFTSPIYMKKNRPAVLLTCLCAYEKREKYASLLLTHTTSLGVRVKPCGRFILQKELRTVNTSYGPVRVKFSRGYGTEKYKPEYDDLCAIARREGLPLALLTRKIIAELESQKLI
mgnify:CR=1 FL=1